MVYHGTCKTLGAVCKACALGKWYKCFLLLFFLPTVTKQRDPETGQQSLLFQVRVLLLCQVFLSSELLRYWSFINPLQGNSDHLTWIRHSSCKSSATHCCQCVQCLHVQIRHSSCKSGATHCCQCVQCLHVQIMAPLPVFGFSTCAQVLVHVLPRRGCPDIVRESARKVMSRCIERYVWVRWKLHLGASYIRVHWKLRLGALKVTSRCKLHLGALKVMSGCTESYI